MKVIETNAVYWIKAGAMTIFPFIFIPKDLTPIRKDLILAHEMVHWHQQKRWCLYGLGLGLPLWFFLYLFCLPVGWNPFRRKWEQEAYSKVEKYSQAYIDMILKEPPYYLWWM